MIESAKRFQSAIGHNEQGGHLSWENLRNPIGQERKPNSALLLDNHIPSKRSRALF